MRLTYTLLFYLAVPLILTRLLWRSFKAPDYRRRWRERFGLFPALPRAGCIWIHAVSVGETRAALPLIRALQARYPALPLLVTTTTPTGSSQVRDALRDSTHHVYLPYDLPGAVKRFLAKTRPRLTIIMETELWPNLFYHCELLGIPLLVANARLSERSARGYARVPSLTAATLNHAALIAAQSETDAARFRALGAQRVQVMGNIKYDLTIPEGLMEQARTLRQMFGAQRPVLIAASTHPGEDELLLDAFARLRQALPDLLLVLVPRHPERFYSVAELCRRRGLSIALRSERWPWDPAIQVLVGDTVGELLLFYAAADVAFVGGSLVPVGGHNVLEPALLGLPLLFGPHRFNFAEASQRLLDAEAAWQVADAVELAAIAERLLRDRVLRQTAGARGRAAVERNRGALESLLAEINELMAMTPQ